MPNTIKQLRALWSKEKESYRTQEIGSGVQKFVKEVLKSEEIFGLSEGRLSTDDLQRKHEFLEEKSKKNKRADVIIFVDSAIVIPVEIERYGNAPAGEGQLFKYQRVWDKKYGLLTDGCEWVFYNNRLPLITFHIDDIFDKTSQFLEFWDEYIQPRNYYLQFFEKLGQLQLFEEDISVGDRMSDFFQDITTLITSFKNKLNIKGYFVKLGKESNKSASEITYAYIIQFILYKTLVDNDFEQFGYDFATRLKRIHKALIQENYADILNAVKPISEMISRNIYKPFAKEQEFINSKLEDILLKPQNELPDVTPWLDIFVFIKRYNFANVKNEIFGYVYENYLKELLVDETQKGQYFTDPAVVDYMLQQIDYTPKTIQARYEKDKNSISLIDPACGSGTFLYSAVSRVVQAFKDQSQGGSKQVEDVVINNLFGLDIAEFPLYLAEMSILMRLLPLIINEKYNNPVDKKIKLFLTRDSVSEFMDTELQRLSDKKYGQLTMDMKDLDLGYISYVREKADLAEMKTSLQNRAIPRRRFDYVIANPPYISYNEASRQGQLIITRIRAKKTHMNNIYGVNLNTVPGRIKPYSPKPNLYAFFIALGLALLKEEGRLCYIVPQTLLTANDLDVIRYHLAKFVTIDKLITFSANMFIGRGLKQDKPVATSSLILIVTNRPPPPKHMVQILDYPHTTDTIEDSLASVLANKKTKISSFSQSKLLQQVHNWSFIRHEPSFIRLFEDYQKHSQDISAFRGKLNPDDDFSFDGGVIIDPKLITDKMTANCFEIFDYTTNDWSLYNAALTPSNQYYSDKSPISFPQGSQGLLAFRKHYKIVWRTRFTERFQFTEKHLLLVNNQSLLVSSNSQTELLFYLALLNSPLTRIILEKNLRQENERNYFVPLRAIKAFVRVPQITPETKVAKSEVIKFTKAILNLENITVADLVDFSKVLIQKFDDAKVVNGHLILTRGSQTVKLLIRSSPDLLTQVFQQLHVDNTLFDQTLTLEELRTLRVIDYGKQEQLKEYVDLLVFALYFDIPLNRIGQRYTDEVRQACSANKHYKTVFMQAHE
jgi:type I restriction-modification system DNA methylase subunit